MTHTIKTYYQQRRAEGWPAAQALDWARAQHAIEKRAKAVRKRWDELEGDEVSEYDAKHETHAHCVRLVIAPDESGWDESLLFGDTYDPKCNPDISPAQLEEERQRELDRASNDGIWGIIGQYWTGEEWEHADSCWGFIGDDWRSSGYDIDIMATTIKAYEAQAHCPHCGRPIKGK